MNPQTDNFHQIKRSQGDKKEAKVIKKKEPTTHVIT